MKTAHAFLAVALLCASAYHAAAQLPQEEVPGTSPAGSIDRPTPTVRPGQPTPKPQTGSGRRTRRIFPAGL
jgi:hypothetical protein